VAVAVTIGVSEAVARKVCVATGVALAARTPVSLLSLLPNPMAAPKTIRATNAMPPKIGPLNHQDRAEN
jgi:hypothetical protein